jgi:hypothetical protein
MTTAVVVATVVTTDLSETVCKDRLLEQLRRNDSHLRASLAGEDQGASVVTAILNVEEFMEYVQEWSQHKANRNGKVSDTGSSAGSSSAGSTEVITGGMDELEFMEHTLQQLRNTQAKSFITLGDEDLARMEEEEVGEDISRYPFQY